MLQHLDVGMRFQLLNQRFLHRATGGVGGVYDATMRMPALTGEMQLSSVLVVMRERHTLFEQPLHSGATVPNDKTHGSIVTQPSASDMGVTNVVRRRIIVAEHGGNTALRPGTGGIEELLLGDQRNFLGFGESQCQ